MDMLAGKIKSLRITDCMPRTIDWEQRLGLHKTLAADDTTLLHARALLGMGEQATPTALNLKHWQNEVKVKFPGAVVLINRTLT